MLTQRLGSDTQKDPRFLDAFISVVLANPGSCDEVWLASDYGFPQLETHRKAAETLYLAAEKLRAAELRVSLQISNTIGHGQYMSSQDCTGLVYENSPVEKMVGHDGTVADYCFCWNGVHFRNYTFAAIREYVGKIKPYCVWVDDDLRASNHFPVEYGCFCDNCIAKFNTLYNADFTRETLVNEINFGSKIWRERHVEFTRNSLYDFTYQMGLVIHEVSPESRMGYQYAVNKMIIGYNCNHIFDAMYRSTGFAPLSRPGGGSYADHDINTFVCKSEQLDMQNRMLPKYVKDRRPEIESLPDIVYGKSIGGTCFETSYYLASGNNAMSYAMLMNDYEPMQWQGQMLHAFSRHRPYWEKLSRGAEHSEQGGFVYALSQVPYMRDTKEVMEYSAPCFDAMRDFRYLGFSIAMKDNAQDCEVRLLTRQNAGEMSDDELEKLLHVPVMTDGAVVELLNQKGFDLPLQAEPIDTLRFSERFADHPACKEIVGRRWGGQFGRSEGHALLFTDPDKTELLSEYICVAPPTTPNNDCIDTANYGIKKFKRINKAASAVFTTPCGAKWAVFGFDMWNRTLSTEKRNLFLDTAAYISGHRQPVEIVTPLKTLLQTRINRFGQVTQASVTNITAANEEHVTLHILHPVGLNCTLMGQYTPAAKLPLLSTANENIYSVTIPNLSPWTVTTLFFGE